MVSHAPAHCLRHFGDTANRSQYLCAIGEGDQLTTQLADAVERKISVQYYVVKSSFDVSIKAKEDPLAFLLKTVITGINESLQPTLGENAIQNAMTQDNSPKATSGRIVSISTGLYEAFRQQNTSQDETTVLKDFINTLERGFEQGYQEAINILKGMNALSGEQSSEIEKTRELVKQG